MTIVTFPIPADKSNIRHFSQPFGSSFMGLSGLRLEDNEVQMLWCLKERENRSDGTNVIRAYSISNVGAGDKRLSRGNFLVPL